MVKKMLLTALAVSLIISSAGCGKKPDMQPVKSSATNVTVYTAGTDYLENTVSYTGELKASENTSITSKVNAKIVSVNVAEGDHVKVGDVLAELDTTDLKHSYDSALASYNSALASYNSVINSATKQASTSAKNSLESAQLAYNQALENYKREKELYESGSAVKLAEQTYNDAAAAYNREKELYDSDTSLVSAKNNLANAEETLANTQSLYDIGAVSKLELDNALKNVENLRASLNTLTSQKQAAYENTYSAMVKAEENLRTTRLNASASYDAAKNALDNAENSLSTAKENIGLTEISNKSNIETAKASLENARNAMKTASDNLSNTKVTAPSSGYISSKTATVGQMASAGMELFSIKNTNALVAEIEVTESVIPYISQGTKAVVDVQSAGAENIAGTVSLVNPTKNEKTGMYTVQIAVSNPNNKLNVGMFADVKLTLKESSNAVIIPIDAVIQEGEDSYVYVAMPDNQTAEKRTVAIGIESDAYTEIISGINPGDRVITKGQDYLSEENNAINIVTETE